MFSLDEDDEGEISVGESSDAEREMTPDIPKAPSVKTFDDGGDFSGASDVDSKTLRAFVVAVIYANAAVLLVALGPMLWFFQDRSRIGLALFLAGLLAGVRTYQTYRSWTRSRDAAEDAAPDAEEEGSAADTDGHASAPEADDAPPAPGESDADADATPSETS